MSCKIVRITEESEFVGRAVCAIGVFDGVHLGHQQLVAHAVELAQERGVDAYVITFDRDPDQVVTPDSAAPQLLTVSDKTRLLCEQGVDAVLVVPFTHDIAALTPVEFLSDVLLSAVDPVAIVVGSDFRFGRRASGTVETLREFCTPRHIDVVPHELVTSGGYPVTSTRIRGLVAAGDLDAAAALLGRAHRVSGTVVRGRGEGTAIGVPTANIAPVPFAALPGAGVYAARAVTRGEHWPAAVSVGRPPTFPEATDVLEAHLIGFAGDLYDAPVTLEFVTKLRDQRKFDLLEELLAAMRADIVRATTIAAVVDRDSAPADDTDEDAEYDLEYLDDGTPVVEDPAALEAAERAVAGIDRSAAQGLYDETWVEVLGPSRLGSLLSAGGVSAFLITSSLTAYEIPFVWQPFLPEDMQNVRPDFNYWTRFSLHVPPEYAAEATRVLHDSGYLR